MFFKIAFLIYMGVSSTVLILCTIFLFLDHDNKTIFSNIMVFIIGKWTGFLVAKHGKTTAKQLRKAAQPHPRPAVRVIPASSETEPDVVMSV